jgi:hypothetical protein
MHALSLVITLGALALAAGTTIVAVRLLRDDRRRSDARVAALSRMADGPAPAGAGPDFLHELERVGSVEDAAVTDIGLFAEPGQPSAWGLRLVIAGALGVIVISLAAAGLLRSNTRALARDADAARAHAPLELLALRHAERDGVLTVSGRVQNPVDAPGVSVLTATVFLFGSEGHFMGSGRARIDAGTLAGGEESAFVVAVPVTGMVARYRVSFRDSSGRAVAHVDRRNAAALARNE